MHGCGDAAKNVAKMQATADAAVVRKTKKEHDTKEAREALQRKRAELAEARKPKPTKKQQQKETPHQKQ